MNRTTLLWNKSYEIIVLPKIEIQHLIYTETVVRRCSVKKVFAKFTRKHLCQRLFLNKVEAVRPVAVRPATLLKKSSGRGVPVNAAKFLRTPFFI